ncbi:MAG: hypothetical protein GXO47_13535 [Chlorobi bacterium]|nr:hypothetical protein [Chlorobiota bacterium]
MNRKLILPLLILAFIATNCGPSSEEMAAKAFNKAEKLYNEKHFNDTKLLLDSIIETFPGQIEYVTRSKDLLRKIRISEQEQNLVFLDSLLKAREEELKPMMKNFIKTKEYGDKVILIHKRQRPENSYNRTFIRAHLDMDGNFYISSRYTGDHWIYHNQVKVYNKDKSALTDKIPEDGFLNRRFEDGGTKWEIVSYKDGKDNGVIDFIAANWDKPLKVQYRGKKYYYIVMEKFDKEAIRDANEISYVLKEIKRIKEEIKNVKQELSQLKPKS